MKKIIFLSAFIFCGYITLYSQNTMGRESHVLNVSGGIAKYNSAYLTKEGSIGYNGNIEMQRYLNNKVYLLGQMSILGRTGSSWTDKLQEDDVILNFDRMEFFWGAGIGCDVLQYKRNILFAQLAVGPNISNVFGTVEKSSSSEILDRINTDARVAWHIQYELGYKYQLSDRWRLGLGYTGNLVGESMNTYIQNKTKKGDDNLYISGFNVKLGYSF